MITPCNAENGCGTVSLQTGAANNSVYTSAGTLPYNQMTDFMPQMPGTANIPSQTGTIASTVPIPGLFPGEQTAAETIPGQPDPPVSTDAAVAVPEPILPEAPEFQVPNNPLLPPGYQEIINYNDLQYLNGFLRTQVGHYIRVEQLVGSSTVEERYGYLVGVGLNYILLQEIGTGNISAVDFYNIKYIYIYLTHTDLPANAIR